MSINKKTFLSSCTTGFYDSLALFPAALSVSICSGFGVNGAVITALVCCIFSVLCGRFFAPSWLTALPIFFLSFRFSPSVACIATALSGVFVFILSKLPKKTFLSPDIRAGFLLAAALCTTALQTTNYFGIGAVGADAVEIIKDYISLGFHGNWRGVLYGTVVLVTMVTYPRKFKNFSKKVPASFVSIVITLSMNLLLNRSREFTPINEIVPVDAISLFDNAFFIGPFDVKSIPLILCTAVAIALIVTQFYPTDETSTKKLLVFSAVNTAGGFFGAVPVATADNKKRTPLSGAVCMIVCAVFFFVCPFVFERIPLHSLAVILIVSAWQSVEWSQIGKAFKGGAVSVIFFVLSFITAFLAGAHYALPMLLILSTAKNNK
ncbi:MAG: SulP family inorganic anion transporter [Clostridia bacterium]|nr:SulP family inorganic anion transporter [Clostridia bacterium]